MDYLETLEKAIEEKKDLKYIVLSPKLFHECQILFTQNIPSDFLMWCLDSNKDVKVIIEVKFPEDKFMLLSMDDLYKFIDKNL